MSRLRVAGRPGLLQVLSVGGLLCAGWVCAGEDTIALIPGLDARAPGK